MFVCTWLLEWLSIDPNYVCALGCWEEPQFKPWGIKKDSVPYMTEVVLTNVVI